MKVKLATQRWYINAPREMVFQMLTAFGKGSLPGSSGESSRILEKVGDTIIAEFMTTSGNRTYRTVEEVRLYPPEKITFRHLEGPLPFSEEEFNLLDQGTGTQIEYAGKIEYKVRWLPAAGWLIAKYYVRPKYNTVIKRHLTTLKSAAEARAARSHVFRRVQKL